MKVGLQEIAKLAGVSVKTASGALHGGSARLSDETRARVKGIADELGYVTNLAARGMRQGWLPIVGILADGLITSPFATEIMRAIDNSMHGADASLIVTSIGGRRSAEAGWAELERFRPRAIAYAAMYHKRVTLPDGVAPGMRLMINCQSETGAVPALVPAERRAAEEVVQHLFSAGRRRLAFLNLPGLLAGALREEGYRARHREAGVTLREDWIRPATRGEVYSDRARSLVAEHVADLFGKANTPDAIVCGNDRVALEVYGALRRANRRIPDDVAVVGFDNQVDIAARLDPPLTTMALPYRPMGRRAAEILLGRREPHSGIEEIPFRLVERKSG